MARRTARPTLRRLLLLMLALYACYLLAANVFINSPLASPLVNRQPERFRMDWSWGLSAWPGHVVLWDLSLQGHVRHIRWRVEAGRAAGYIALLPLTWRELRVPALRGRDIVAVVDRVDEELPVPEPRDGGFLLHFPRIALDTPVDVTLEGVRIAGHATGHVGWQQQLRGGPMQVFPSQLVVTQAAIARKEQAWVHDAEIRVDAQVHEHRRREFPGIGLLQQLTAAVHVQGLVNTLSIDYREPVPAWSFAPGQGTLVADLGVDRGEFTPNGQLSLLLPVHAQLLDGHENRGDVDLQYTTGDAGQRLVVLLPPVDVLRSDARFDLSLPTRTIPQPPWQAQVQQIDGSVALHSRFDSLGWVTPMLERLKGFQLDGSGELHANLQIEDGTLTKGSTVTVDRADLWMVAFDHRIRGLAKAQADVVEDAAAGQRTHARVVFDRFDIAAADAPDAALGAGTDLALDLDASGALHQLRDSISAKVAFKGATLDDLTLFNRYLPAHGLRLLGGRGTLGADMHMDVPNDRSGGRVRFDATRAALRVGDLAFNGDVGIDATLADAKLGDMKFGAGGSRVSIRNARIDSPKGERDTPWWATLELQEGDISLARPLVVQARGRARMRDIGFVLSLFSAKKDFPKWIARLLDAGETTVEGQLHLVEKEVVVDRVVASNDRFDVQARLRLGEGKPVGDLYARWGVLGFAMELDRGERETHLVGAKKWFESRPNYLPE